LIGRWFQAVPTALPHSWPAEREQNFVTIADHHTAGTGIRQIDHDVPTDARRGRKNDTLLMCLTQKAVFLKEYGI
jgi:hypothetical protein